MAKTEDTWKIVKFETISWINKNEDWTNHKISYKNKKNIYIYTEDHKNINLKFKMIAI